MKFITIIIAALILGMFSVTPPAQATTKVPEFSVTALNGSAKTIDIKDFRGKVVLVVFWATWCPPCMQEVPSLISLQKEFAPKGFSVIGLSVNQDGTSAVSRVISQTGMNYPVAIATEKITHDFGGIIGIPTAFIIDRDGNVVKRYTGWTSHKVIARDLKQVLK
ncbi:TlpA family protein disulfide reductase [Desulfobacterota bacterium M19]